MKIISLIAYRITRDDDNSVLPVCSFADLHITCRFQYYANRIVATGAITKQHSGAKARRGSEKNNTFAYKVRRHKKGLMILIIIL